MEGDRPIDLSDENRRRVVTLEKSTLRRSLGVRHLFSVGYGDVGSSIYYALGVTALWAGPAAPVAIGIAGVFFVCTVLTYTELSAARPIAGGSASFARESLGDLFSLVAGWALLLSYIMTIAISAYAAGSYLGHFFPALKATGPNVVFTICLIGFLTLLNIVGIRESAGLSLVLTVTDVLVQVVIIILGGFLLLDLPALWGRIQWGVVPTWPNFLHGITMAMLTYTGIEAISQMSEEVRDPARTLPRAMKLMMGTVLVIFAGISLIALSAMTTETLTGKWLNDPLAGIAANMPTVLVGDRVVDLSRIFAPIVALLGFTILTVAANAGVIGGSRLAYSHGSNFQMSAFFARIHPRFKTPYISLLIFSGAAIEIVLVTRRLEDLADLYVFGAVLSFTLAHLSMIISRIKEPDLARPFVIPWNLEIRGRRIPVTAVLGLLANAGVWAFVVATRPLARVLGLGWMAVGIGIYLWYRRKSGIPLAESVEIAHVAIPEFQRLHTRHILVPTLGAPLAEMLQAACKIAKADDAKITALYVLEIPPALPVDTFLPNEFDKGNAALDRAKAVANEYEIPVETKLIQAHHVGEAIVETAREIGCDLILLGARSRKPLAGVLFGHVTDYVTRAASCRVWISSSPSGFPR